MNRLNVQDFERKNQDEAYRRWLESFKLMQDREPSLDDIIGFVQDNIKPDHIFKMDVLEEYGPDVWLNDFEHDEILNYVESNVSESGIQGLVTKERVLAYIEENLQ